MNAIIPVALPWDGPLPLFAPLNAPMVAQILHYHLASTSVVQAVRQYPHSVAWLRQQVPALRAQVVRDLAPLASSDTVSVGTFVALLRASAPPSNRTDGTLVAQWRDRGLLATSRFGYLEPQRAAAVLLARRLLPHAVRRWLPDELVPSEPLWWCWRQDSPQAPITLCPMPLPAEVPAATLLWTPWAGAAWLPQWRPVATGALHVGGITTPQAVREAADLWQRPLDPVMQTALDVAAAAPDTPARAQQVWLGLATPLVLARFEPIVS